MVLFAVLFGCQDLITVGLMNLANVTSLPTLLSQVPQIWPACPRKHVEVHIGLLQGFRATEQRTNNSMYMRAVARSVWITGQCAEAIQIWLPAQQLGSRQSDQLVLAQWYLGVGDRGRAIETYRKVGGANFVHGIWEQVRRYGNTPLALAWQDLYVDLLPSRENVQWLADTYILVGRATDAAAVWNKLAAVTHENNPQYWFALGRKAQTLGDCKTALDFYQYGQLVTSSAPFLLSGQAECLVGLGRTSDAVTIYMRLFAYQHDATTADAICNLLREQRQFKEARTWCDRAIALPHADGAPEYRLGLLLQDVGDWRGSEQALRGSLTRFGPHDAMVPLVLYPLAQVVYRQSRYDEAYSLLESAINLLDENRPERHTYTSLLHIWDSQGQTDHH